MEKNILQCFSKKCRTCCEIFVFNICYFLQLLCISAKEIGKCEHAGKEGMQSIERTFKTRVKYCLMFIEIVWEVEYFCI